MQKGTIELLEFSVFFKNAIGLILGTATTIHNYLIHSTPPKVNVFNSTCVFRLTPSVTLLKNEKAKF
jgi:hypothetical protein